MKFKILFKPKTHVIIIKIMGSYFSAEEGHLSLIEQWRNVRHSKNAQIKEHGSRSWAAFHSGYKAYEVL